MPRRTWSKDADMSAVERRELWFTRSLSNRETLGVDQPNFASAEWSHRLAGVPVIIALQVLHAVAIRIDVILALRRLCAEKPLRRQSDFAG